MSIITEWTHRDGDLTIPDCEQVTPGPDSQEARGERLLCPSPAAFHPPALNSQKAQPVGPLKSLAPSFENNQSSCSLPTSPDSDEHRKAEEWEMPHTQLSLALRDPLALDGSRPQCEPGFSGSPRLCVQNFAETLSAGRTRKKTAACHELGQQEFVKQDIRIQP